MHLTTATVWEAELRRQDLLAASQQQRVQRATTQTTPLLSVEKCHPLHTVKVAARYTAHLLTKLGAADRREAAAITVRHGLV